MDTTANQLQNIFDLAFETRAEIAVAKTDDLPPESSLALEDARKAADRIVRLVAEEFGPGVNGGLVELEEK